MIVDVYYRDCGNGFYEIINFSTEESYGFVYPQFIDPIVAQPYLDD